jgi:peptidyl-tRNA hydrolase
MSEDRLVMYIVVPRSLKMRERKLAAWREWLRTDYGKIVLGASDAEFAEARMLLDSVAVVDIGLKEVTPGSVTAVGLWPMLKSAAPAIIQGLRPL